MMIDVIDIWMERKKEKRDVEQAGFPVTGKVGPNGVHENIKELEELKEPVKKDNEMLNELLEQMSSISMKVEDIEKERKKEKSIQYDLSMMYELRDEQRALDQRLSAQKTRLLSLEESGADNGRLIWKIEKLTEERSKAIRYGNSLFSPTFLPISLDTKWE
eukprot:gene14786-biopygen11872